MSSRKFGDCLETCAPAQEHSLASDLQENIMTEHCPFIEQLQIVQLQIADCMQSRSQRQLDHCKTATELDVHCSFYGNLSEHKPICAEPDKISPQCK